MMRLRMVTLIGLSGSHRRRLRAAGSEINVRSSFLLFYVVKFDMNAVKNYHTTASQQGR
jgi:hypothetical protein